MKKVLVLVAMLFISHRAVGMLSPTQVIHRRLICAPKIYTRSYHRDLLRPLLGDWADMPVSAATWPTHKARLLYRSYLLQHVRFDFKSKESNEEFAEFRRQVRAQLFEHRRLHGNDFCTAKMYAKVDEDMAKLETHLEAELEHGRHGLIIECGLARLRGTAAFEKKNDGGPRRK